MAKDKDYNNMTESELLEAKRVISSQIDALNESKREIARILDKRAVAKKLNAMTESEKESIRQIIGE
jgi:hypothetical protein